MYLIRHADFVLAENWDLRFGVTLWQEITRLIDNDGITVNTSLGDALGINLTSSAPTRTRRKKMVIEDATPVNTAPAPEAEPELEEEDEPVEAEVREASSDNSITGILEGNSTPKGLFDD